MSAAGPAGTSESAVFRSDMLAGRVALVTGGGTGIGLGIASCLAAAGATVAIASRIRRGSSSWKAPQRKAMPHSPSPSPSIQPTGPA